MQFTTDPCCNLILTKKNINKRHNIFSWVKSLRCIDLQFTRYISLLHCTALFCNQGNRNFQCLQFGLNQICIFERAKEHSCKIDKSPMRSFGSEGECYPKLFYLQNSFHVIPATPNKVPYVLFQPVLLGIGRSSHVLYVQAWFGSGILGIVPIP